MRAARARLHHTLVGGHSCHPMDVRSSIEVSELFFLHAGGFIPSLNNHLGRRQKSILLIRPELGTASHLRRGTSVKILSKYLFPDKLFRDYGLIKCVSIHTICVARKICK